MTRHSLCSIRISQPISREVQAAITYLKMQGGQPHVNVLSGLPGGHADETPSEPMVIESGRGP